MKSPALPNRSARLRQHRDPSRGVALIVTLLLLMLMVAMTLAMTIAVTSDTLITRYYREFRASFYAADSGVNVARVYVLNQLTNQAITVGQQYSSSAAPPLAASDVTNALASLNTNYAAFNSILGGAAANSWPSSFEIVGTQTNTMGTTLVGCTMGGGSCTPALCTGSSTTTCYSCTVASFTAPPSGTMNAGPYSCTNVPACTGGTCTGFSASFQYSFPYTVTAIGESHGSEQQIVEDAGSLIITVNVGPAGGYNQSFAAYGTFLNAYTECSTPFAPGYLTGPFFTNGAWTYTDTGSYTFSGKVGSVATTFGYDFGGAAGCVESANPTQKSGSNTIAPTYQAGYALGENAVTLPTNDFSQKEAVVDGLGNQWSSTETAAQQDAAMNAALKTVSGTAYPSTGTTNAGVYMPYTTHAANPTACPSPKSNCMTGGGIYVESNANSVMLNAVTSAANNSPVAGITNGDSVQQFQIVQGTTTTNIYVDETQGNTYMQQGSSVLAISGVPENFNNGTTSPATMLFVDGTIGNSSNTGLSGPGQGQAAIQNDAAVTITAAGNIDITGDILYKTEPVTTTQNQIPNTPADTLIPGNNNGQVLGLFTATGNIAEYNQQSNGNIEIDAALAMISSGSSGGWVNDGNAINTLTLVGGRSAMQAMVCNCTTRNIYFDQRFGQGTFAPPWFPATTITPTTSDQVTSVTSTVQRTQWLSVY